MDKPLAKRRTRAARQSSRKPVAERLEHRVLLSSATPTLPAGAAPGTIEAENYNLGGEGVGYHDTSTLNQGGAYRHDRVGIDAATDAGGGYYVGWTRPGEWLQYTTNVAATTSYTPST